MIQLDSKIRRRFDFPVEREAITNPSGKDTGYDMIYRTDTGTNLGVVSRDYKLIRHAEVIDEVFGLFQRKRLPKIEPLDVIVSAQGARLFASFKINKEADLGVALKSRNNVGDIISPGFMITNSYDRTIRFTLETFVFRLVCSNGMIAKEELFKQSQIHRHKLNIVETVERFIETLERFDDTIIPQLASMTERDVTPGRLEKELNSVPGWVQNETIEYLEKGGWINLEESGKEIELVKKMSLWELLNGFTFVLSHSESVSPERRLETTRLISERFWAA